MTTLQSILEQIRQSSQSERKKEDRFEILMKTFFKTDPTWVDCFEDVWKEWPELSRYQFSRQDTGIDLVARERDGGGCAIQCKCFDPHYNVQIVYSLKVSVPLQNREKIIAYENSHFPKGVLGQIWDTQRTT